MEGEHDRGDNDAGQEDLLVQLWDSHSSNLIYLSPSTLYFKDFAINFVIGKKEELILPKWTKMHMYVKHKLHSCFISVFTIRLYYHFTIFWSINIYEYCKIIYLTLFFNLAKLSNQILIKNGRYNFSSSHFEKNEQESYYQKMNNRVTLAVRNHCKMKSLELGPLD